MLFLYKLYAKIINNSLRVITEALFKLWTVWFRVGQSCIDNVFPFKRIIEKTESLADRLKWAL